MDHVSIDALINQFFRVCVRDYLYAVQVLVLYVLLYYVCQHDSTYNTLSMYVRAVLLYIELCALKIMGNNAVRSRKGTLDTLS
jgi:hypothetical protein